MRPNLMMFGAAALLGLAACAETTTTPAPSTGGAASTVRPNPRATASEAPVPVFNQGGQQITTVPASQVRGVPRGTPILVNRGGENITVILGRPLPSTGVSAGTVGRVGSDGDGRVLIQRTGPGGGNLAPSGVPHFVGTGENGEPLFSFD